MRIAYVGNFRVPFSTESHVALSLEALGHEVIRHDEEHLDWLWAPHHALAQGVDFVLWTHTHGFAPETRHDEQLGMLDMLRQAGIPSVAFHLDRWWGLERESQLDEPFFTCDLVFTADGGGRWAEKGINHVWSPPAVVHTEVGRGERKSRYSKRIGFVGSWREYGHAEVWPWRFDLVSAVWRRYGSSFRSWPRNGEAIRGRDLNDLYASVDVVIGDSCLAGGAEYYWSDRVPETLGRGGFLIHPDVPGLKEMFPTGLPVTYPAGDLHAVFELLDYWSHPSQAVLRDEMTADAIEWVRAHHTYLQRMQVVVERVERLRR